MRTGVFFSPVSMNAKKKIFERTFYAFVVIPIAVEYRFVFRVLNIKRRSRRLHRRLSRPRHAPVCTVFTRDIRFIFTLGFPWRRARDNVDSAFTSGGFRVFYVFINTTRTCGRTRVYAASKRTCLQGLSDRRTNRIRSLLSRRDASSVIRVLACSTGQKISSIFDDVSNCRENIVLV